MFLKTHKISKNLTFLLNLLPQFLFNNPMLFSLTKSCRSLYKDPPFFSFYLFNHHLLLFYKILLFQWNFMFLLHFWILQYISPPPTLILCFVVKKVIYTCTSHISIYIYYLHVLFVLNNLTLWHFYHIFGCRYKIMFIFLSWKALKLEQDIDNMHACSAIISFKFENIS